MPFSRAFFGDACVVALAVIAAVAAWMADEPEAYLFPRLVTSLLAVFATVSLVRNLTGAGQGTVAGINPDILRKIAPGVLIMVVYVALADVVGFYVSAAIAYGCLSFACAAQRSRRQLMVSAGVAVLVAVTLYLMFSVMLKVQAPRGFLF